MAELIKISTPTVFNKLPESWDQTRLAGVIENIRMLPGKSVVRHGKELMFDYGKDENGEYIAATKAFFAVYASYPVNAISSEDLQPLIGDLQKKMLHEVSHLILNHAQLYGNGGDVEKIETEARENAQMILDRMSKDLIKCEAESLGDYFFWQRLGSLGSDPGDAKITPFILLHRTEGYSVVFTESVYLEAFTNSILPVGIEEETHKGLGGCLKVARKTSDCSTRLTGFYNDYGPVKFENGKLMFSAIQNQLTGSPFGRDSDLYGTAPKEETLVIKVDQAGQPTTGSLTFKRYYPTQSPHKPTGTLSLKCQSTLN